MTWTQDLDKTAVWRAGMGRKKVLHCSQVEDLEISGEEGLAHVFRSGQTAGVQGVEGPEATRPRGQQPP